MAVYEEISCICIGSYNDALKLLFVCQNARYNLTLITVDISLYTPAVNVGRGNLAHDQKTIIK